MKRLVPMLILGSVLASPAIAGAEKGKMLFDNGGKQLGVIYKVTADGSAQLIIDGKLVTIPANTLKDGADRVETSLSKSQVS